jgi:catechol 2,3-dioxygenase-like lactoylglutathione lyase family enzyme
MHAKHINPILNVSDLAASFDWFARLGWGKNWQWGDPPDFGSVGSGECEIFLCVDGQGSRGRGDNTRTMGPGGDDRADRGVWLMVWVDAVDPIHQRCLSAGLEVTFPPTSMPWGVREMHVRHPDGHVLRIGERVGAPRG